MVDALIVLGLLCVAAIFLVTMGINIFVMVKTIRESRDFRRRHGIR